MIFEDFFGNLRVIFVSLPYSCQSWWIFWDIFSHSIFHSKMHRTTWMFCRKRPDFQVLLSLKSGGIATNSSEKRGQNRSELFGWRAVSVSESRFSKKVIWRWPNPKASGGLIKDSFLSKSNVHSDIVYRYLYELVAGLNCSSGWYDIFCWQHRCAACLLMGVFRFLAVIFSKKLLDRKRQAIPCHQNFHRLGGIKLLGAKLKRCHFHHFLHSLFVDQSAHNLYLKEKRAPATSQKRGQGTLFSSKTCICYQIMLRAQKLQNWIAPWWFSSSQMVNLPNPKKAMNNSNDRRCHRCFWMQTLSFHIYCTCMSLTSAIHGDSRFVQFSECNRVIDLELSMIFLPPNIWTFILDLRLSFEFDIDLHFCWNNQSWN